MSGRLPFDHEQPGIRVERDRLQDEEDSNRQRNAFSYSWAHRVVSSTALRVSIGFGSLPQPCSNISDTEHSAVNTRRKPCPSRHRTP